MESYPLDHQGSSRAARFTENSKVYSPDYKTDFYSEVLCPAQQVGIESCRCTVWKKEIRDRIKVSKIEQGDSRTLGSRALFFGDRSLLFSVLAYRKYLMCYDKISPVSPVMSCIAIFCLYSFPMVILSWLSRSNRRLLTPALDFGPCQRFTVIKSASVSDSPCCLASACLLGHLVHVLFVSAMGRPKTGSSLGQLAKSFLHQLKG